MPRPDGQEQAHLRQQAIRWLRAELDFQRRQLATGTLANRYAVQKTLRLLFRSAELAGIHDEAELRKLPEGEAAACRRLWADMTALLDQADPPGP